MLFLWALLLLLPPPSSAAGNSEVFFAQVGGSITLPYKGHLEKESVYVKWFFFSNQEDLLIWKHPKQDSPKNEAPEEFEKRVFLSKDSSLVINPVQETDFARSGFFKCVEQDYKSKIEKEFRLYRVYMPSALTLLAGDDLSLSCQTEAGVTAPSVRWISPSSETYSAQPKNSLSVTNISSQHSGVWTCQAESDPPKLKATTTVTVIDLSPSQPNGVYTSLSSGSPWLPCSLSSAVSWSAVQEKGLRTGSWSFTPLNPTHGPKEQLLLQLQPPIAWKKTNNSDTPNKPFLEERELKDRDLSVKIPKVSLDVRGTYTCSLEFSVGRTLSRTLQLEVLEVLSSPSAAPQGVMARAGDTVNLTCTLGHSLPSGDLQVTWVRPKSSVFSLGNPPHPARLSIPAVTVQDSGQWRCELKKNTMTLTSATVTLEIKKRVDIWVFVAIGSALVFILLLAITVFFFRRHKQAKMFRRRRTKFCCCKNPQPKGFYKT
ncbi:CD4-1 molecule [Colossoma macropomum]|uniref:CD4-1 molecule n=1 Tax=Colossoma macropomum TaxID=42526 RepID=UPI0018652BD7|nr:CD4-1 molecule [Colossoma macropomum]